jgi:hypothetical protein
MVPDIAEGLVEPLADLSQFQILEVEQLQRSALHLCQIFERGQKLRAINSETHLALDVVSSW